MAFYRGRPIDAGELFQEERSSLAPALHKSGNSWYKMTHKAVTVYSLDRSRTLVHLVRQIGDPVFDDNRFQRNPGEESDDEEVAVGASSTKDDKASRGSDKSSKAGPLIYWEECIDGNVPEDAVCVGKDRDHGLLYVGRGYIFGCLLPGKVAVGHRVCYVALEGREFALGTYEVLVVKGGRVKWEPSTDGYLPPNALPTGYNLQGDTIYSAKARCENIDTPGHFIPAEKKCCIAFNVQEYNFTKFDVLTIDPNAK